MEVVRPLDEDQAIPVEPATHTFPYYKAGAVVSLILACTVLIWVISISAFSAELPSSIPLLVVAYTLGLRHALDADHIAAIDNVTRRLIQNGQYPVSVGLFFSLGHSTIVIIVTMIIAAVSASFQGAIDENSGITGILGSAISASFLLLVGIINGVSIYYILKEMRVIHRNDDSPESGGIFTRLFGKTLFKVIDRPYKMYVVGFLFGLGFDTASEVGLLGIAAIQAAQGTSRWLILFLPLLFTCGMTLIDTLDGILMLGAYGWALVSPAEKLQYNLIITSISMVFALVIALIEILGVFQDEFALSGGFWDAVVDANDEGIFLTVGVVLLGSILAGWALSKGLVFLSTHRRLHAEEENAEQAV